MATGTVAFTYDDAHDGAGSPSNIHKLTMTWTSTAGGAASDTTRKIVGELLRAVTVPTDGPTDDYDITITDESGANVLTPCKKTLADRDTTNTEEVNFMLLNNDGTALSMARGPIVCDKLTIAVAAAGASKSGVLYLYWRVL